MKCIKTMFSIFNFLNEFIIDENRHVVVVDYDDDDSVLTNDIMMIHQNVSYALWYDNDIL